MKGQIFNIQRYSTHDGPGIRTVVFLKGCPLRCFWCQNPESQELAPVLMQNSDLCTGCGACEKICPYGAASIINGKSVIDRFLCSSCGQCTATCRPEGLSVSGYESSVDEIMDTILKDRAYFRNSGGGVTLSGGEVTMQPDFALALLKACKAKYLHTAVETCGYTRREVLEKFITLTDLFFYDIKAVDSEKHVSGTGKDNALIKSNAIMLAKAGCKMLIRMPLIPGYNDFPEDVLALRRFVEYELGLSADRIELLKYNSLGEVKFARMGRNTAPALKTQSDEYFDSLKALLK